MSIRANELFLSYCGRSVLVESARSGLQSRGALSPPSGLSNWTASGECWAGPGREPQAGPECSHCGRSH